MSRKNDLEILEGDSEDSRAFRVELEGSDDQVSNASKQLSDALNEIAESSGATVGSVRIDALAGKNRNLGQMMLALTAAGLVAASVWVLMPLIHPYLPSGSGSLYRGSIEATPVGLIATAVACIGLAGVSVISYNVAKNL